jgi:nicotinamidase/pyrazinamidase
MNLSEVLFWNVDTQVDFVSPEGKLYVPNAELLKSKWQKLTGLAKEMAVRVVNTADFHFVNSAELDPKPDFINTFPPHCMANTAGANYIEETTPENPIVFEWDRKYDEMEKIINEKRVRNIVIRKDAFDVFKGNANTDLILKCIAPKVVFVYGVTTNVCVNDAVVGLSERVEKVIVVEDAIKELPNIPLPFENWKKLGVEMIQLNELEDLLIIKD